VRSLPHQSRKGCRQQEGAQSKASWRCCSCTQRVSAGYCEYAAKQSCTVFLNLEALVLSHDVPEYHTYTHQERSLTSVHAFTFSTRT
jgi:hypothetical protein